MAKRILVTGYYKQDGTPYYLWRDGNGIDYSFTVDEHGHAVQFAPGMSPGYPMQTETISGNTIPRVNWTSIEDPF